MSATNSPTLRVLIDGSALDPEKARALWSRFSQHMDAHRGDFDGFAAAEGFRSARVAVERGKPTLHLSNSDQPPEPASQNKQPKARQGKSRGKRRRGHRKK